MKHFVYYPSLSCGNSKGWLLDNRDLHLGLSSRFYDENQPNHLSIASKFKSQMTSSQSKNAPANSLSSIPLTLKDTSQFAAIYSNHKPYNIYYFDANEIIPTYERVSDG